MSEPLQVNRNPCSSCPYRKDTPSGVWSHEDYEKLRKYDDAPMPTGENLGVFLCHHTSVAETNIACKGWLIVHDDSIAVRLALVRGQICIGDLKPPDMPLHESGAAAANFGQKQISRPNRKARTLVEKLAKTGKFKE